MTEFTLEELETAVRRAVDAEIGASEPADDSSIETVVTPDGEDSTES